MWHSVLSIETNSTQYWFNSHNTILFFIHPRLIILNTSPLAITCITASSDTPWLSHIWPWLWMGWTSQDQTSAYLTPYYHSRPFNTPPTNVYNTTPTYVNTSFWHHIPINDIPTYAHFSMHIRLFIQHFLNSISLSSIYLTINPVCANSFLCNTCQSTHWRTWSLLYVRV